jgi:hypothetical protein
LADRIDRFNQSNHTFVIGNIGHDPLLMVKLGILLDLNPALVLKSSQAGRLLLENTFQAAGMSPSQAADAVDRIVEGAEDFGAAQVELDETAAEGVLDRIENRLVGLTQQGQEGKLLGDQLAALGSTISLSDAGDKAKLRWTVLAGTDWASQNPELTKSSAQVYVQPVHEIFIERGWEVF